MSNGLSTSSSSKSIMSVLYGQEQHNVKGSASGHVRPEFNEQQAPACSWNNENAAQSAEVAASSSAQSISYSSPNAQAVVSPLDPCLRVELQDLQLWERFSAAKTEMIVTKPGRRMFPGYRVKFYGMDQKAKYCVLMDIVSVDQHRYKFQNGAWAIAGRGEPQVPQRFYLHPTSPASGQDWMKEIVSFHKLKLTNSCGNSTVGKFLIHSMHRYQPRIHVVRSDDVSTLHLQPRSTFSFPQTMFITVTAYQNQEVTKLKVDNNPFARGFRTNGGKTRNAQSSIPQQKADPVFNTSHQRIVECLPVDRGSKRWQNRSNFLPVESHPQYQVAPNQQLHYSANYPVEATASSYLPSNFQPFSNQTAQSPNEHNCSIFSNESSCPPPFHHPANSAWGNVIASTSHTVNKYNYVNLNPVVSQVGGCNSNDFTSSATYCGQPQTFYNDQVAEPSISRSGTFPSSTFNARCYAQPFQFDRLLNNNHQSVLKNTVYPSVTAAHVRHSVSHTKNSSLRPNDEGYLSNSLSDEIRELNSSTYFDVSSAALGHLGNHRANVVANAASGSSSGAICTNAPSSYRELNLLAQSALTNHDEEEIQF